MQLRQVVVGVAVAVGTMASASAQGIEGPARGTIAIESCLVEATVEEGVARVEIQEVFRNLTGSVSEGVYSFKLPEDAVIGSFSMWMEGKEQQARVMEAKQARATYDAIVRKQRDPGLLEQVGWRTFRVNVYPIPRFDTVRVRLVYSHVVRDDLGLQTLEIALPQDCGPVGDLRVHAKCTSTRGLSGIDCPSHADAKLTLAPEGAEASWSGDGVVPGGPFVLRSIPRRIGFDVEVLAHRPEGAESGWFVARVAPRLEERPKIPRDLVFVIDRSGSMSGVKMEQARAALLAGIDSLGPGDRFDVVSFSTDVTSLGEGRLLEATAENLARARAAAKDLTPSGGTNIHGALLAALAAGAPGPERFSAIVFLTDGDPTVGERDPGRILASWREKSGGTRLFAFGVGRDVKDFLLTKLAVEGRGDTRYVREDEDLEVALSTLFERVKTPLLLDPTFEVEGDGIEVMDREPRRLPDLFERRSLVVSGRFKGSGKAVIRLRGKSGEHGIAVDVPVVFPQSTPARPHLAQIWAKSRVERLLDDLRIHGPAAEFRDEVLRLGLEHQLVTPYTSFLVLEEGAKLADGRNGADDGTTPQRTPEGPGVFRGPNDTVPVGLGGPGPAGPGAPTNGGAKGPTTARVQAAPGGGSGGGMRPSSGGLGCKRASGEGFERWEFWWEHNQSAFLETNAVTPNVLPETVLPALLHALKEPHADVADSAAIAIGRCARPAESAGALKALVDTLAHKAITAREAAVLAMGVLGSSDAAETLFGLMNDTAEGRRASHSSQGVEDLVRAFAATSLGLIGDARAIDDLMRVVADRSLSSKLDLQAMAILALGMMEERHADIVSFLLAQMEDRGLNNLVRAQAPIALGRLHRLSANGSVEARKVLGPRLIPRFEDDKTDRDLRRSLAICIGMLGSVEDAKAIETLMNYAAKGSDEQTRHFSIMALAEIGMRDPDPAKNPDVHQKLREFFELELIQPKRLTHQPFGALALAVYARNEKLPPEAKESAAANLLSVFKETSNPSYKGAMAVGLGLLDSKVAGGELWRVFEDANDHPLKGHIAVALGTLGLKEYARPLRRHIVASGADPKLRLQLARALALMQDEEAVPALLACLEGGKTLAEAATAAQALGRIGSGKAVAPLLAILGDSTKAPLVRGLAAAAIGVLAERTAVPWNSVFSVDANYRAKVAALAEILDLL